MRKKFREMAAIMCLSAFCLASCQSAAEADTTPTARVGEFSKNDIYNTLAVDGTIESADSNNTILTNLVTYKVKKVNFKVGDHVNAGDVVCELDTTDLENDITDLENRISNSDTLSDYQFEQYEKALDTAKKSREMQLNEAQKAIDDANNAYNQIRDSYNNNLQKYNDVSSQAGQAKANYENAQDEGSAAMYYQQYQTLMQEAAGYMTAYEAADAKLSSAQSAISSCQNAYNSAKLSADNEVEQAQYKVDTYKISSDSATVNDSKDQLEKLKKAKKDAQIIAANSGIVSSVSAEAGKVCADGVVMVTQNDSDICVHVTIKEEELLSIEPGMKALVSTPATGNETFDGIVDRVLDIRSQNGFDGYIAIDQTDSFRIGMNAKVKIVITDEKDVLSIKNNALFTNEDGNTCVYEAVEQADGNYTITETQVDVETHDSTLSKISADSLSEGDYIVLDPKKYSDGDSVKVRVSNSKKDDKEEKGDSNADTE
ncbi:MAG: efflux RND transporter periplasmic adaptor subunit [Oscillospiraceae bacterium]|nr:efflux RND transporter periplasmic adaptor subunit [Oscillospiraceae bacterium]